MLMTRVFIGSLMMAAAVLLIIYGRFATADLTEFNALVVGWKYWIFGAGFMIGGAMLAWSDR